MMTLTLFTGKVSGFDLPTGLITIMKGNSIQVLIKRTPLNIHETA